MKQLDEMERMARKAVEYSDPGMDVHAFAEFVCAVMPTIRAALDLHESDYISATMGGGIRVEDSELYAKLAAVYDAIDDLRRRLGGE